MDKKINNQDKEFKKRTWFYFIQQKVIELSILPVTTILPYFVGKTILEFFNQYGFSLFARWLIGLTIILLLIIILFVSGGTGYLFIKSNWDWAKRRTEKYFKK